MPHVPKKSLPSQANSEPVEPIEVGVGGVAFSAQPLRGEPTEGQPLGQGNGDLVYDRRSNSRSDSRMICRLLGMGVVDEDKVQVILEQAYLMAAYASSEGDVRSFSRALEVILGCARLEQAERHKLMDKAVPDAQGPLTINGQPINPAQLWETFFQKGPNSVDQRLQELEEHKYQPTNGQPETNGQRVK